MEEPKLYLLLLGCRPPGRLTEQHDIFFGIAKNLKDLILHIKSFWPEVKGNIHIDAWREVTQVNNYQIKIIEKKEKAVSKTGEELQAQKLFFLNLGGYKAGEFDEFHYKVLSVAHSSGEAIQEAKQTAFYKHVGFKGASSHIDDKYGIDIDDVYAVNDVLLPVFKEHYSLQISRNEGIEDMMHLGFLPMRNIK